MFTSVIDKARQNRRVLKAALAWLAAAAGCVIFNQVYAIFGHDVQSASMATMYLYPLLGGTLGFGLLALSSRETASRKGYRLFLNLYSSGLATLVCANLLKGIFEIAGTSSAYVTMMAIAGWGLAGTGLAVFVAGLLRSRSR